MPGRSPFSHEFGEWIKANVNPNGVIDLAVLASKAPPEHRATIDRIRTNQLWYNRFVYWLPYLFGRRFYRYPYYPYRYVYPSPYYGYRRFRRYPYYGRFPYRRYPYSY